MIKIILLTTVLNQHTPGAGAFAPIFSEMGIKYHIDPLLLAAVAFHESRFDPEATSKSNDFGLMQIHVGETFHKEYEGQENLLFEPRRNVKIAAKLMKMWKRYHLLRCKSGHHHWLNHYNQGTKVSNKLWRRNYAKRVLKVYKKLLKIKVSLAERV